LGHLEVSEFLEKMASLNSEKNCNKYFKSLENLEIPILMLEVFFSSMNKNVHGNLPEAGRFKELDHKQYELERFDQCIIMDENLV
jgi:hypothetical protein